MNIYKQSPKDWPHAGCLPTCLQDWPTFLNLSVLQSPHLCTRADEFSEGNLHLSDKAFCCSSAEGWRTGTRYKKAEFWLSWGSREHRMVGKPHGKTNLKTNTLECISTSLRSYFSSHIDSFENDRHLMHLYTMCSLQWWFLFCNFLCCYCSGNESCLTLCNPMDCSYFLKDWY